MWGRYPCRVTTTPPPDTSLQAWQVIAGGILALVLCIGVARFAYTPLLPLMQQQAGLSDLAAGWLAATNYMGYMSGALLAAARVKRHMHAAVKLKAHGHAAVLGAGL